MEFILQNIKIYFVIFLKNLQFICKTWGGNDGPMNGAIFSLRVSQ
jgi:hypothetical protein